MNEMVLENSKKLLASSKIAMLGTLDKNGYPNVKAMLNVKTDGLKHIWFSTNTDSKRVQQILQNKKACVYYHSTEPFMGLMLVGEIEILQDETSKKMLWFDGCEKYYPKGVTDPDYSVLYFTAVSGHYYHNLEKASFDII